MNRTTTNYIHGIPTDDKLLAIARYQEIDEDHAQRRLARVLALERHHAPLVAGLGEKNQALRREQQATKGTQ